MPVDLDGHSRSASASEEWVRVERDALGEGPDGLVEDDVKVETPDVEQLGRDVGVSGSGSGSRDSDSPSST